MHIHWGAYVLVSVSLILVISLLSLRVRHVARMREKWITESLPKDGHWYDAGKIVTLVKEKYPIADRLDVHMTLEEMEKRGKLQSRTLDERYEVTHGPVLDPFGQWRWLLA